MNTPVLRVQGLSKRFAETRALEQVSFEVRAHEVVGLVGENGAGKSTLLKVLAGLCRPDAGRMELRGQTVSFRRVSEAVAAGIGMVSQEQSLLPNLSVAENIFLGHEDAALRAGFYDWKALNTLAAAQLDKLGSRIPPSARTDSLSFAERQVVELAKIFAIEERTQFDPVILLDEPTSMLDGGQIETVLARIESLRERASVVFVSHRLEEVMRVCDRIDVMMNGRCVAQRNRGECDMAELQQLMLGRDLGIDRDKQATPASSLRAEVRLSVRGLSRARAYRDVSFELRAGEVLGIAGAEGSGRESLCRSLFGAEAVDSGEIVLDGERIRLDGPADAVRLGIGYVPAERRTEGIVAGMSVRENMSLATLHRLRWGPLIDLGREKQGVDGWMARLRIQPCAPQARADHLSGGNQQKLVLAKWLFDRPPRILLLDHPMRGLDVGAKRELSELIRELARGDMGILLIADTLADLIALSDTIIVMKDGLVSGSFPAGAARPSEQQILERTV